jgi:hypothetical protein
MNRRVRVKARAARRRTNAISERITPSTPLRSARLVRVGLIGERAA